MDRAAFLLGTGSIAATGFGGSPFAVLEDRYGGRLGVAALNASTGVRLAHRANERFAMCSTFKVLVAGTVLARVDAGRERLDRRISYGPSDLLTYAPVTREHVGRGYMTVGALCEAALEYSDNTAANLLLRSFGGPPKVTAFVRSIGDEWTRLDRTEPSLNTAIPDDPRDTTTPREMLATLHSLLFGTALSRSERGRLDGWMTQCKTGDDRIRAGVPRHWRVSDKTGSGDRHTSNDIAAIFPPNNAPPIVVTAYYTGSSASSEQRDGVLAEVGRIVSSRLV